MNIIDLHVHSNKSDGSFTPTELVNYAIEKGLSAFALTDHDTTDGIDEALAAAEAATAETAAAEAAASAAAKTLHAGSAGMRADGEATAPAGRPLEVIPGIEFSTEYEGQDIHIVGLYIDYKSDFFRRRLVSFVEGRITRNKEMCRRLTEHGIPVTYEELTA